MTNLPKSISEASQPTQDQVTGCLLGGAVGDALGAPIEFDSWATIRARYGDRGLRDFDFAYGRFGAITDDTQMTLFTAEGLIRARLRTQREGHADVVQELHAAYLRWLLTQNERPRPWRAGDAPGIVTDGWLLGLKDLHEWRAPGNTCLAALRSGECGTFDNPINDSKGCGGVMRVAPVALWPGDPFRTAAEAAAITHGHPSGYLSAGVLAAVIAGIFVGQALRPSIEAAVQTLRGYPEHEETLAAIEAALRLADAAPASPQTIERLGGGWVGEEALAISLFCALKAADFEDGVCLAVNHSGDCDSTGAITGNILGALYSVGAIPQRWLAGLELREEITMLATDLWTVLGDGFTGKLPAELGSRYP